MNLARRILMARRMGNSVCEDMPLPIGYGLPGPGCGQYDPVTDTGYYGLVPSADLISGDALASLIGLTAGASHHSNAGWFKFYVGPAAACNRNNNGYAYVAYVAKMPNRRNISWNQINAVNAVYGNRREPIRGMNCQVRLITGANQDPSGVSTSSSCESNNGGLSEWNNLMYRIHTLESNCSSPSETSPYQDTNGGPQIGDNWAEYVNGDIGLGNVVSQTYCQEKSANPTTHACVRGTWGISTIYHAPLGNTHTSYSWRPVLQPTSLDPDSDPYDFSV